MQSVFWALKNSDPHKSLSFDCLHNNNLGMFGNHLWKPMKQIVEAKGRQALANVEAQ